MNEFLEKFEALLEREVSTHTCLSQSENEKLKTTVLKYANELFLLSAFYFYIQK